MRLWGRYAVLVYFVLLAACRAASGAPGGAGGEAPGTGAPLATTGTAPATTGTPSAATIQAQLQPAALQPVRITALAFAGPDRGYLAQGKAVRVTRDGGRTWSPLPDMWDEVQDLDFVTPDQGWAVAGGRLLATADGGQTWRPVPAAPAALARVDFATPGEGWAVDASGILHVSRDGGRTWQPVAPPCQGDGAPLLSAPAPGLAWVLCPGQPATQQQPKELFRTRDGGATWERVADSGLPGHRPPLGRLPMGGHARDLVFLDSQRGWLAESRGVLLATADGGRTWDPVPALGQSELFLGRVRFVSAQQGYVVLSAEGQDILYGTWDGRRSVARLFPPANPWPWQMIDATTWVAAGSPLDSGAILRTEDAGRTWRQVGSLRGQVVEALSFASSQDGWALASRWDAAAGAHVVTLYRTWDGGATWEPVRRAASDPQEALANISFVGADTGFVVTGRGRLYRTRDGGRTLVPLEGAAAVGLDLAFVSAEEGWMIQDFRLYATRDGGHTWQVLPLAARVIQFQLLSGGAGWAVGQVEGEPALLFTRDGGQTWTRVLLGAVQPAAVRCAAAGWCLLRAQDGSVYATADGGRTWAQVPGGGP